MGKRKSHAFKLDENLIVQRHELSRSGAAGVHQDQNARRRHGGGRVNRVNTRSAARRAAISNGGW